MSAGQPPWASANRQAWHTRYDADRYGAPHVWATVVAGLGIIPDDWPGSQPIPQDDYDLTGNGALQVGSRVLLTWVAGRCVVHSGAGTRGTNPLPPPPPFSSSDLNYVHVQSVPSAVWVVVHGLGKLVAISVVDSGGTLIEPDVLYDSVNQVTVSFGSPTSGQAFVN